MSTTQTEFDRLEQELADTGVDGVLDQLVAQLREKKKYHELFEALKMRVRHRLGLPITYSDSGDELDEPQRNGLEEGLIDACREVGMLRSEEHTSELQSRRKLVCRLLLEKKNKHRNHHLLR